MIITSMLSYLRLSLFNLPLSNKSIVIFGSPGSKEREASKNTKKDLEDELEGKELLNGTYILH